MFISFPKRRPRTHRNIFLLFFLLSYSPLEAIEFSQFYLPPCCHIGPHHPPGVVASAPSEQNGTISYEPAHPRLSTSGEEVDADTNSLYKLIVPLKFPSAKAASTALSATPVQHAEVEAAPPAEETVVVLETTTAPPITTLSSSPEGATTTQKDVVNDASSDVFNVFLYKELQKMRRDRENHPLPLPPMHSPGNPPPNRRETVFDKIAKLGYTMSERLQQLSSTFNSIAAPPPAPTTGLFGNMFQNSHGPYQMYKTFVKRQAGEPPSHEPMKMPAVWIKNLRKALYQSLSSRRNGAGKNTPSIQESPNPSDGDSKLLWKNLRSAKLKFIDLASQATSDLPEEIYLPPGQGPIVSGIATLAGPSGNMEIRIPSELYTPSDSQGLGSGEGVTELCKCSLLNDGDMVLAYWSISRIVTKDGHPALQYLVYPLPYPHHPLSPPTPPQLVPFNNGSPHDFRPSQHDPLPNYFKDVSKNHHEVPIITDARHRAPKLHHGHQHSHQGLNELHHGEYPPNIHTHPPTSPAEIEGPVYPHSSGPERGVPIEHNGKYTEDFLSLYRDAVNHHFQNIDSMKSVMDDENIEDFINQHFPYHQPHPPVPTASIPPPPPPSIQHEHQHIPFGGGFLEGPPTAIPGFATPLDPPTNLHDHPKSIQDILSPFIPPPPPPHSHLPPRHHYQQQNPNQPQRPQRPFNNNNNFPVDDGLYYDDRKYQNQNPNIPPQPFNNNRPGPGQQHQQPNYYRPPPPPPNRIPYDDIYDKPVKPVYNQNDKRPIIHSERDAPKKQSYVKDYYHNNNHYKPGVVKNSNFAQRTGGSINDIDNPDGYILDFKK